ncbi:dihydroxyacetone kinase subunit L [Methylocapsa sp. S129]|uniref:dihydroxyacetone kinase subunit L n=1 Tax=Methylocapsa sp. S129 TaxID=1641869 RepID=UPI00131E0922|nr:dihydroxyacetone kinase subunit L [Methylocapsa sp. S129]
MDAISSTDLVALFAAWRATFAAQREFLISLDGRVGDSDLGITMAKAFAAAAEAVAAAPSGAPIGKILITAGLAMAKAAPSTMGTLTATGFMRGGKALESASAMGVREVAAFWRAYGNGVAERGKAKLGDKTILDVIDPVATTLKGAVETGDALAAALSAAASVAEEALENTKTMVAQHGKAAAFQEKSVGHQDAGATVGVLMIQIMRDFTVARSSAAGLQAGGETAPALKDSTASFLESTDPSAVARRLVLRRPFGISVRRSLAAVPSLFAARISSVLARWMQVPFTSNAR